MNSLLPTEEEQGDRPPDRSGDEASLRQALVLEPGNEDAICGLAELLVEQGQSDEALALLARIPRVRAHPSHRRRGSRAPRADRRLRRRSHDLLDKVKGDDEARQQFVDILELMGPHDPAPPRTARS